MCSNLFILVAKFFLKNSMDCQALGEAAQGGMESAVLEKFSQLWICGFEAVAFWWWLVAGFGDLRGLFQPQQFQDSPPLQRDLRVPLTGSFWSCEDLRT